MRYQVTTTENETVLALSERFTAVDSVAFRRIIDELSGQKISVVVIDLAALDYIDSAAMGLLVLVRDTMISGNIEMKIRSPRGQVKKAFEIFNFEQLFAVEE
jgi:anti-anti-sigma factor